MTANTATADPQTATIEAATEETFSVTEAVALFATEQALEEAVTALQENGIDRARISVLGTLPASAEGKASRNWVHHLVDLDSAPRGNPSEAEVLPEAKSAIIALPGYGGAMAGLIAVMATGGTLGIAIASAIALGAAGTGGGYLLSRVIDKDHHDSVSTQLEAGGLVLWVALTGDQEEDGQVSQLLADLGGSNVHVTHRQGRWGAGDIPLATAQPDPFL